ncbi:MAG TPA: tRNA pseudouridine(55) synthase TruB [Bacteroidia bacterium]|jgi:tRNA pseudouridine55 synthase
MRDFRAGEVILINKPLTWTSFQVVNKMKYVIKSWERNNLKQDVPLTEKKLDAEDTDSRNEENPRSRKGKEINSKQPRPPKMKIGHAGTLDPLATGLLIVCTGKQTKNIESYQAQEKEYTGTFYLGATTPSYDLEKEIDEHYPTEHITDELIYETVLEFFGNLKQTPPIYSAIRIDGRRAYKIARSGKTAEMPEKEISITEFEITRIAMPEVDFRVVCSKGTYIRSLARDFGEALKTGAHLTALCRTRIGEYRLEDAMTIEQFEAAVKG